MRYRKRDCPSPVLSLLVAAAVLLWPAGIESATRGREDLVELISEIETAVWSRGVELRGHVQPPLTVGARVGRVPVLRRSAAVGEVGPEGPGSWPGVIPRGVTR